MGSETIATYYILGKKYNIMGCWDKETPENTFDFYDVYSEDGECINLCEPFYDMPTYNNVVEYVTINKE